jgi:amino-acid N-acetyltransferase
VSPVPASASHGSSVTTRRATPADATGIVALIEHHVGDGTLLPRGEAFVAAHAADFIVAERDGRIVGCVHLDEYAPSLAEIRSLAVAESERGTGVGTLLVTALERLARGRDYTTLFAVSNRDDFFRRRGYLDRQIPELDRERSAVSRYKGVFAKEL